MRRLTPLPSRCAAVLCLIVLSFTFSGCETGPAQDGEGPFFQDDRTRDRFFEKAGRLEAEGEYEEAFELYDSIPPEPGDAGPCWDWARARYRMGRCEEEMDRIVAARRYFADVLRIPNLSASDGDILLPGQIDINLRKRTEGAMERIGFESDEFYLNLLRDPASRLHLCAVKSLERVGGASALPLLRQITEGKDDALKAAAIRALNRIQRRLERAKRR